MKDEIRKEETLRTDAQLESAVGGTLAPDQLDQSGSVEHFGQISRNAKGNALSDTRLEGATGGALDTDDLLQSGSVVHFGQISRNAKVGVLDDAQLESVSGGAFIREGNQGSIAHYEDIAHATK